MFNGTHFLGFKNNLTLALGQHFGPESIAGTFFQGDLAEVLIHHRSLTATERCQVGSYLAGKYGLQAGFRPIPQFEKLTIRFLLGGVTVVTVVTAMRRRKRNWICARWPRGGKAGLVIVRGFSDLSEMVLMIESGIMPPEGEPRLTPQEISTLRNWLKRLHCSAKNQ